MQCSASNEVQRNLYSPFSSWMNFLPHENYPLYGIQSTVVSSAVSVFPKVVYYTGTCVNPVVISVWEMVHKFDDTFCGLSCNCYCLEMWYQNLLLCCNCNMIHLKPLSVYGVVVMSLVFYLLWLATIQVLLHTSCECSCQYFKGPTIDWQPSLC